MAYGRCMTGTHRPKKSLGQHFLVDGNMVRKMVNHLALHSCDTVFEIGPGRGALTQVLAEQTPHVIVLEKDPTLLYILKSQWPRLGAVLGDALDFVWEPLARLVPLTIVGNLPYNVASPVMWEIFSRVRSYQQCCFMVQKEVALRLVARPGTKAYGGLSVWVQTFAVPRILFHVPPSCFRPRPKVDSSVLGFVPRPGTGVDRARLASTIRLLFQKRRKQLGTILKPFWTQDLQTRLEKVGVERRMRPENLSPEQVRALSLWL